MTAAQHYQSVQRLKILDQKYMLLLKKQPAPKVAEYIDKRVYNFYTQTDLVNCTHTTWYTAIGILTHILGQSFEG